MASTHRYRSFLLGAFPLSIIATAYAQNAAPADGNRADDKQNPPISKVEITGNLEKYNARRDDTAVKIVVSSQEIEKYGDTSLADVLKRQPGVTVSGGSAGRGGGEIRMRGLGAGYTQVLLNGDPAPPGFSLDTLSPAQVERIEIIRAATADLSTQAIAGTINIILKTKVVAGQRELKSTVERSNTYFTPSADLQISDKAGNLAYTVAASVRAGNFKPKFYQTDEAYDAAGNQILLRHANLREDGKVGLFTLSPRLIWTLDGGDKLIWQSFANIYRVKSSYSGRWKTDYGDLPTYSALASDLGDTTVVVRSDVNWIHTFKDGGKLDTKIGFNAVSRDLDRDERGMDVADVTTLNRSTENTVHNRGGIFVAKYSTNLIEHHRLATGLDAGSTHSDEARDQRDRAIPGYVPVNLNEDFSAQQDRLAVFAQDEWQVTPKWSVYLGVRAESLYNKSSGTGFSTFKNRSSVVSPLFQTLWKFPNSDKDQLRLAVTRTFNAPAINRMIPRRTYALNNNSTTPDTIGNPDLKPELASGVDIAYEHFFSDGAMVSAAFNTRTISDFIYDDISLSGGRWLSSPVNDGKARTRSIELEAKFPLRQFFPTAPAIDFRGNIARNWSSVDSVPGPDNRIGTQTPVSGSVALDYTVKPELSVGGSFTLKTGGPVRVTQYRSIYNTVKRELELYGQWKIDGKTRLRVSAVNVLAQPAITTTAYTNANGMQRDSVETPFKALLRVTLETKF